MRLLAVAWGCYCRDIYLRDEPDLRADGDMDDGIGARGGRADRIGSAQVATTYRDSRSARPLDTGLGRASATTS